MLGTWRRSSPILEKPTTLCPQSPPSRLHLPPSRLQLAQSRLQLFLSRLQLFLSRLQLFLSRLQPFLSRLQLPSSPWPQRNQFRRRCCPIDLLNQLRCTFCLPLDILSPFPINHLPEQRQSPVLILFLILDTLSFLA
jgi:hypothetical protein